MSRPMMLIRSQAPMATRLVAMAACLTTLACATPPAEEETELPGGAVTLWTDSTELFMEHPALVVGDSGRFAIHLTDLTDFAPLTSGRITLRFEPRGGGTAVVVTQDAPRAPGIFGASPRFSQPGVYDLHLLVESPQARDSLFVPALQVYATAADVPVADEVEPAGISFLKEQQWKTPGFATAFATSGTAPESFEVGGEIVPAAGHYADVQAPVAGLIDAAGLADSPVPGGRVRQGQLLAVLTSATAEGGNLHAEARARLREAEDELARARRLVDAGVVPRRRLHEAEIRFEAAQEAMSGLGAVGEGGRYEIRAPISGVIASRDVAAGARVEAGASLFRIVDPDVVWLQSFVPAGRVPVIAGSDPARFRVDGLDSDFTSRRLLSVGAAVDPVRRMVPVLHEVGNPGGRLRIGALARVALSTGVPRQGMLVPASALVDEDGRPIVYVQVDGELFEARRVTLGGRTGDQVLVVGGIVAGERVVTGAAFQVRLASLSTAVPAHGHEH